MSGPLIPFCPYLPHPRPPSLVPQTPSNATEETRSFQYLSFYQKEMALYQFHALGRGMKDMCLDAEMQPLFKVWILMCGFQEPVLAGSSSSNPGAASWTSLN